eukprot:11179915-Lingulodinium_polyedra.AAC.1
MSVFLAENGRNRPNLRRGVFPSLILNVAIEDLSNFLAFGTEPVYPSQPVGRGGQVHQCYDATFSSP